MIPMTIQQYLQRNHIPFALHPHPRAVAAQQLAAALHVSGYRVAKSVIVRADGRLWIAVLPATETIDFQQLARVLGAWDVRMASEQDFKECFPGCELGAEPPFGLLYRLPVVIDPSLGNAQKLLFRAGSHEEALEMSYQDFLTLEWPLSAPFISKRLSRREPPFEARI